MDRFTSTMTASNLQNWNPYSYVCSNSLTNTDEVRHTYSGKFIYELDLADEEFIAVLLQIFLEKC